MAALLVSVLVLCMVGVYPTLGSPTKTYDQRQQGELNIHAQLDNIVILLIPTSNFNLLGLTNKNKYSGEKPGGLDKLELFQMLQKPDKIDIDRYEFIKEEGNGQNDIKNEETVMTVNLDHLIKDKNEEKDEGVVAMVEEMKPVDSTEKATAPTKSEIADTVPMKEHSTVGETLQESVLKVSMPQELKNKFSESVKENKNDLSANSNENSDKTSKDSSKPDEPTVNNQSLPEKETSEKSSHSQDGSISDKVKTLSESPEKKSPSLEDLIRPISSKEEHSQVSPSSSSKKSGDSAASASLKKLPEQKLIDSARREKVIRYNPESKWAPGLVDLLSPPRPKARELEERQRFADLCSPGVWDTELKTCIMPGDTRSRIELARFLEAMRFGIAVPTQ